MKFYRILTGTIFKMILLTGYMMMSTPPAKATDGEPPECLNATRVNLDTTYRGGGREEALSFYEVEVLFPGILALDVVTPARSVTEATLAFLGGSCPTDDVAGSQVRTIQRFITAMVLRIEAPGTYRFAVAAQDPDLSLDEYKLITRFVNEHDFRKLSAARLPQSGGFRMPEPDKVEEPEPQPEPDTVQHHQVREICREHEEHDPGDTFLCAADLDLGSTVTSKLDNDWGDDEDLFSFDLTTQRTVQIRITGDLDTFGVLYDRYGHRLAMADNGDGGSDMRIVKTLAPGRYYLRITGANAAEDLYTLTTTVLSW